METGVFGANSLPALPVVASEPESGLEPALTQLRQVLELSAAALPPMSRTALPSLLALSVTVQLQLTPPLLARVTGINFH